MEVKDTRKKLLIVECFDKFDHHSEVDLDGFMFLTDDEADEACKEHIQESIWTFRAEFLASYLGCPVEAVQAIQDNDNCEDNNQIFTDWLENVSDLDDFCEDAISEDGRGHFLASYDSDEHEVTFKDETYYIYRIN